MSFTVSYSNYLLMPLCSQSEPKASYGSFLCSQQRNIWKDRKYHVQWRVWLTTTSRNFD